MYDLTSLSTGQGRAQFGDFVVSKLWTLISILVGVSAASAPFGWMAFRLARHMDRAEREPRYRRRWLFYVAAVYAFGIVAGVSQVLSGDAPPATLLAALIPLFFVWFFLRAAKRVKIPPD
jgi:hypothetical protein